MVGGSLRDFLLGKAHKDLDLLVTGLPQDDLMPLLRRRGRVQRVGQAFGVLKFMPREWDAEPIDVAVPRVETSTGTGHRDFEVAFDHTLPVEIDLARRDFTINAMALDLGSERLIDPFGGRGDLDDGVLRQVSPVAFPEGPVAHAARRAVRQPVRVARGAGNTGAMSVHAASISTVAPERIAMELQKLFRAARPSHGFILMHEVALLPHLFPEIERLASVPRSLCATPQTDSPDASLFGRTVRRIDAARQGAGSSHEGDLHVLLAALWLDCREPEDLPAGIRQAPLRRAANLAQQRLEAFRATTIGVRPALVAALINGSGFDVDALAGAPAPAAFRPQAGRDEAFMVIDLRAADCVAGQEIGGIAQYRDLRQRLRAEIERGSPLELKDLAVNGDDLRKDRHCAGAGDGTDSRRAAGPRS